MVVLLLLNCCLLLLPLWESVIVLCFVVRYYISLLFFYNHLDGKTGLVALLSLSSWCLVIVVWLFLAVPWVCLQFVIVVFPDHTHLLFLVLIPLYGTGASCEPVQRHRLTRVKVGSIYKVWMWVKTPAKL